MPSTRASASIERAPSNRAPSSIRPRTQPTTLPSASRRAVAANTSPAYATSYASASGGSAPGSEPSIRPATSTLPSCVGPDCCPMQQGGAQSGAHVAGGGRGEDAIEHATVAQFAGGHAVLRASAAEQQKTLVGDPLRERGHPQDLVFEQRLHRRGEIGVIAGDRAALHPGQATRDARRMTPSRPATLRAGAD